MVGICTDVGNVRKLNEDYANYFIDDKFEIFIVADGMGGHNAGEIASRSVVDDVIDYIKKNYTNMKAEELLKSAIEDANYNIYVDSLKQEALNGMGTTITACFVSGDLIQVANVGDSCCLGIKDNTIKKITKDHSLVQELVDCGSITEKEAKNHPHKNVITRAIGTSGTVNVDIFTINRMEFESLVLCSDGLTNELSIEEILETTRTSSSYQEAAENLIFSAKQRGGRDNITVLIFGGEI